VKRLMLVAVCCLLVVVGNVSARQESYQVESVSSGDVAVLKGVGPVRLIGVEIPQAWAPVGTAAYDVAVATRVGEES
jgi:IMP dehydrogenase/GMP reductase